MKIIHSIHFSSLENLFLNSENSNYITHSIYVLFVLINSEIYDVIYILDDDENSSGSLSAQPRSSSTKTMIRKINQFLKFEQTYHLQTYIKYISVYIF